MPKIKNETAAWVLAGVKDFASLLLQEYILFIFTRLVNCTLKIGTISCPFNISCPFIKENIITNQQTVVLSTVSTLTQHSLRSRHCELTGTVFLFLFDNN